MNNKIYQVISEETEITNQNFATRKEAEAHAQFLNDGKHGETFEVRVNTKAMARVAWAGWDGNRVNID